MGNLKYKAALSRSKGREYWCVIYKHPLRSGKDGKPGLRVRKGLGTTDQNEAQNMIDQLNEILRNEKMWSPSERQRAEQKYHSKVVSVFYDAVTPEFRDPWAIRERILPLPSKEDGYAKVFMVGTTGAGKTTVVRQLIGTDPDTERFPSTSSAKTTISHIELITTTGPEFKAIVSFFDKNYVRQHIEECVMAAIKTHLETGIRSEVESKFLVHSEQRFRLSYLLGSTKSLSLSTSDEDGLTDEIELTDEDDFEENFEEENSEISRNDRELLLQKLTKYISRIQNLSKQSRLEMAEGVGIDHEKASKDDLEALDGLIEEKLYDQEEFQVLVDEIFDEIEDKFGYLQTGNLTKDKSRWPSHWEYSSDNRNEFIKTINRFSSNYAPNFGCLLTPLVEGIRVAGPFKPSWFSDDVQLVIMDGEGLGHTPDSASSISTSITGRFRMSDAIVLVDNAAQPMQAAPTAVLQSLVSSGHHRKLIVCFTHFDEVKGINIPTIAMRKDHVLDSFDNSVAAVGKTLGQRAEKVLKERKTDHVFFLSKTQKTFKPRSNSLIFNQFNTMMGAIKNMIVPPPPTTVIPVYDDSNLVLNIQKAAMEFHKPWEARLRLIHDPEIKPEHWARIKALTRRLGEMYTDEYNNLKPVAELISRFQTHLYLFIENPLSWDPDHAPDEMKHAAIDNISQKLETHLHEFFSKNLFTAKIKNWHQAYSHRGNGSARIRAYDIREIYHGAAPIPGEVSDSKSSTFVKEIRTLLHDAVIQGGGKIQNL